MVVVPVAGEPGPVAAEELVGRAGGDAMVRAFAPGAERAWCGDGAVAMVTLDAEDRVPMLLAAGTPAGVSTVVVSAAADLVRDGLAVPRLTVPRGAMEFLPARLRPRQVVPWEWRSLDAPPPVGPGEDRVSWLGAADHDDVTALLEAAGRGTSVWPGDPAARRWAGIRDDGALVACLADTSRWADVGHISGISTAPSARGHGHATTITAWASRRLLGEGARLVTLGVFASNAAARRVYDRLGFTATHPMTTGDPPAPTRS